MAARRTDAVNAARKSTAPARTATAGLRIRGARGLARALARRLAPAIAAAAAASSFAPAASASEPEQWVSPISLHSQTYACCMPFELKEKVVREATDLGAGYLRVDIYLDALFDAGGERRATPDFSGIDEIVWLARRYQVRLLAIMVGTPGYLSTCPQAGPRGWFKCPPRDVSEYGRLVAEVVARAPDVFKYVEVWNEPDGSWSFAGQPADYAAMLQSAYRSVKTQFPDTQIVIAAPMTLTGGMRWYEQLFAALGRARPFDVANAHVRVPLERVRATMLRWRRFYADHGVARLPLWVTEFAYPSDPRWQIPPYNGGELAQARYYQRAIPELLHAGADQVFVTLRDGYLDEQDERWLSEGLESLDIRNPPYALRRKPAFAAVRGLVARLAREWQQAHATWQARAAGAASARTAGRRSQRRRRSASTARRGDRRRLGARRRIATNGG